MRTLALFEVGLVISAALSYRERMVLYFAAYNLGFLLFRADERKGWLNYRWAQELGKLGFTFFLGAEMPLMVFGSFFDYRSGPVNIAVGYIFKIVSSLLLAYVVTKYVEKPLLKCGKRIEERL